MLKYLFAGIVILLNLMLIDATCDNNFLMLYQDNSTSLIVDTAFVLNLINCPNTGVTIQDMYENLLSLNSAVLDFGSCYNTNFNTNTCNQQTYSNSKVTAYIKNIVLDIEQIAQFCVNSPLEECASNLKSLAGYFGEFSTCFQ